MTVAFYNIFGELKNAEQETLMRLQYVFEKQGHRLLVFNRDGYITNDCKEKGSFIEDIDVQCIFTFNNVDFACIAYPDTFCVFLHWSPIGFVANFQTILALKMFHAYDFFGTTYEHYLFQQINQIPRDKIPNIGSSVPKDYANYPLKMNKRRLFYVGINFEASLKNMRYGRLLSELDKTGQLEIYGPTEVYGARNLWAGFQSYKGEIPFDGKSIIEKINKAGVCLALNSPMHSDADAVSNRTYEGAAAGAVIISDDNAFVRKYFGDSVFYIDCDADEEATSKRILEILDWVNEHPDEAYDMACRSQKAFFDHLTLDQMVEDFVEKTTQAIKYTHDVTRQKDVIDIICFVEEEADYMTIYEQLKKQYYQNLHLIIIGNQEVCERLQITYPHDFVQKGKKDKGRSFCKAIPLLRGEYFMFMDKESVLHMRHIYKNHEVLSQREEMFAYSGCYLRRTSREGKKYVVMNNKPILRDEFLLFSTASNENTDWHYRDMQTFYIETIFTRSAALFKRSILTYADREELSIISDNVHMYLACCSIIKANKLGRFTYALTTGYWGDSVPEAEKRVFGYARRHWHSNCRSAKTYIKEFNEIFLKYTFECFPANAYPRNFNGEITWYNEIPIPPPPPTPTPISWKRKLVRFVKKFIPKPVKEFIKKCIHA